MSVHGSLQLRHQLSDVALSVQRRTRLKSYGARRTFPNQSPLVCCFARPLFSRVPSLNSLAISFTFVYVHCQSIRCTSVQRQSKIMRFSLIAQPVGATLPLAWDRWIHKHRHVGAGDAPSLSVSSRSGRRVCHCPRHSQRERLG